MSKDMFAQGFGAKTSAEGASTTEEPNKATNSMVTKTDGSSRGRNMLEDVASSKTSTKVEDNSVEGGASKQAEGEPSTVTADDSWTKESALKELKKTRDEAKSYRLEKETIKQKYEESIQKLKEELDQKFAQKDEEYQELRRTKEEYAALKAKEEDKKRDLAEKLAHRESLLAETKAEIANREKQYRDSEAQLKSELQSYKIEAETQKKVYEQRVQEELSSVPEKFKDVANLIIKGAGDPRDALLAINKAKLEGLFAEKTVSVNHSVPGAKDGARSSKERLDQIAQDARNKMPADKKISAGLKEIRSGQSNTMYRNR